MTGHLVLDEAAHFLGRFVHLSPAARAVCTLWAAHTHIRDAADGLATDTSPRLAFLSDLPASGKTTALETVGALSRNGQQVIDLTPAGFATMISEDRATVLLDEIDILFGAGGASQKLRSQLNAGYRTGAVWRRQNKDKISIFAPVALAGLGTRFRASDHLAALRSRCIQIEMEPRPADAEIEPFIYRDHSPMAGALCAQLGRWVLAHQAAITERRPEIPDKIADRRAELCTPLLAVADAAGGHWPETAREALVSILLGEPTAHDVRQDVPLSTLLLRDLEAVFREAGSPDHLSTVAIVEGLLTMPGTAWSDLWPNEQRAPRELSQLLAPLGVGPCSVRDGDSVLRGYKRGELARLWAAEAVADVVAVAV